MTTGDAVGRREGVPQSTAEGGPGDGAVGRRERVPQRAATLGSAVRRDRARNRAGQRRLGEQRKPLRHHFPEKRLRLNAFRYVFVKRPAPPKKALSDLLSPLL